MPLRRLDECKACRSELHVCRLCVEYDPRIAKHCREPTAEEVRVAVEPFLNDASEPVRFAAATNLFDLNLSESAASLVAALETEESLRIKNRIAQGLVDRKWPVPADQIATCQQALPDDYRLDGAQIVRR